MRLFVLITVLFLASCGGSISDAARARYAEEIARCMMRERAIVDREGTTAEQDRADMDLERARCDAALDAIEAGR
jgi:hypothetical protein